MIFDIGLFVYSSKYGFEFLGDALDVSIQTLKKVAQKFFFIPVGIPH